MHAMLAGYTSCEVGMKRLAGPLQEPLPSGPDGHATLIARFTQPITGLRPAVLDDPKLVGALDGLRGFRHVASHAYDRFDEDRAALAARDTETFLAGIGPALARFRAVIDPDQDSVGSLSP